MKGTIVNCLERLVADRFGKEVWLKVLDNAGVSRQAIFLALADVPDEIVLNLVNGVCKELNIGMKEAADAFGDYWVNEYASKMYANFFRGVSNAKEFLLKMDKIHTTVTKTLSNASPPKFSYRWADEKTLLMRYDSERNLIHFFQGLVKGVGKYYGEDLVMTMRTPNEMEIQFQY